MNVGANLKNDMNIKDDIFKKKALPGSEVYFFFNLFIKNNT